MDAIYGTCEYMSDASRKKGERNAYLLFREHTAEDDSCVIPSLDEWIAQWREEVSLEEKWMVSSLFDHVEFTEKSFASLLRNLEILSKEAPDIYRKIVNKRFGAEFLLVAAHQLKYITNGRKSKLLIQKIIKCIQENQWDPVGVEELIEVADNRSVYFSYDRRGYIKLWKQCFGQKFVLDMRDVMQSRFFKHNIEGVNDVFEWGFDNEEIQVRVAKDFFRVIDGVVGMDRKAAESFLQAIIDSEDKELLYLALSKDIIPVGWVKKLIIYAKEKGKVELIPLLIMKQFGEWPAITDKGRDETDGISDFSI